MGLADSFAKEDRIPVMYSDLFKLLKEAAKSELVMNAVNCDVPHEYIRETMTGTKESEPTEVEIELNTMKMKIKLDTGARIPTRAHATDAGLDLYARESQIVRAKDSAKFDTGVHIELPHGTTGFLKSKSGLNVNNGITSEGVIDEGYTGSIVVKLYNNSENDFKVKAGQKISQLVILPVVIPETLEIVQELENTDRGEGGFGSTGA
jgi:dUTP pyrophosphatase